MCLGLLLPPSSCPDMQQCESDSRLAPSRIVCRRDESTSLHKPNLRESLSGSECGIHSPRLCEKTQHTYVQAQKTYSTTFLLRWQKSMTHSGLTTIQLIIATQNQSRWFICSKRSQQPRRRRRPWMADPISKISAKWEDLFTTMSSYLTWIITVLMHCASATTPGLLAVQLTGFSKGDQLTGTGADRRVWVGTETIGCACTAVSCARSVFLSWCNKFKSFSLGSIKKST